MENSRLYRTDLLLPARLPALPGRGFALIRSLVTRDDNLSGTSTSSSMIEFTHSPLISLYRSKTGRGGSRVPSRNR